MSVRTMIIDGPPVVIPADATSLDGFRRWMTSDDFPDTLRATFANGQVIIGMSPESIESHNKIKTAVSATIAQLVVRDDLGQFYSDRTMVTNAAAGLSTEPDATFASWDTLSARRLAPVPMKTLPEDYKELIGTPDWVLEIISNSSFDKDTRLLRERYFAAGVPEYWLIDGRGPRIDFNILVRGNGGYQAQAASAGWHPSPVFRRDFRLTRKRDRMGWWAYTLDVRQSA